MEDPYTLSKYDILRTSQPMGPQAYEVPFLGTATGNIHEPWRYLPFGNSP